ncbi:MAG: hypothetical protein AAFN80_04620 [Pseudomonadota bacterium]
MPFPKLLTLALTLVLTFAVNPAQAQDDLPESVFRDYDHMREVLDTNMMSRQIGVVMRNFGASDEMTPEQLTALENQVRGIFPQDFENADIILRDELENGWVRELLAYYTGISYIYVSVFYHKREDFVVVPFFRFNTDMLELLTEF